MDCEQIQAERDYYKELCRYLNDALAGRNNMPRVYGEAMAKVMALAAQKPENFVSEKQGAIVRLLEGQALINEAIDTLRRV